MSSTGIRRTAIGILLLSAVGFFFGGSLPIPLMGKFFLGAFCFGSGAVLLIVANVLRVKEYEGQAPAGPYGEGPDDDSQQ